MELKNIQFRTTVLQNNSRYHRVYFEPKEKMEVISQFMIMYSISESVQRLLSELIDGKNHNNNKYIGRDEGHIYISNLKAIFDMELVTQLKPIEIQLDDAIALFNMYNEYLIKDETCKIPGLLPENQIKK